MKKGTLKIKSNRKIKLKIDGKEYSIPKEFDFLSFDANTYDCVVELQAGKIINIAVNNSTVPKKKDELRKKEEIKKKQEAERILKQETEKEERLKKQNKQKGNKVPEDSFSQSDCRIPNDIPKLGKDDLETSNFALKFYKFARFDQDNKAKFYAGPKSGNFLIRTYDYGLFEKITEISTRHKGLAENLFKGSFSIIETFKPDWRVIVGLGTDSVYETGITLHHTYGFPYIPASAIKGITNHYAQDMLKVENAEQNDRLNEFKVTQELYIKIFGDTNQQGEITFFDAMPLTPPKIKPDIMNVHYHNYYGGEGKAPTDTQDPRPIFFLTVEDTAFQFILGCKDKESNTLLETAFGWMKNALSDKGIGAKTAVGYGYFH